ncbi:EscF/YscF/HrpA family type III secretion system needle major subunit [Comamonas sp. NLF-1-9]|uniref:EscF/YscF/HrpA family type III secretion system needle major subunit n=1 Tax=Comamonas sp. NLF-1-9 TaxID=2853163 RepID=UPI001C4565D0|nr:EscF/YscF/HrpA family type III secretion system needle major subunit [Comamonas sp. NLF-1-9]QXL83607.1 EscF/YscF/HrpA family type III secretion system needle major subunit [Comamonas sp. NLF-1-9]
MTASVSPGSAGGSVVSFDSIAQALGAVTDNAETNLRAKIDKINSAGDGNVSQADMLMLQADLQKWSMMIQLQSTITKELGDALKGIIQKAG